MPHLTPQSTPQSTPHLMPHSFFNIDLFCRVIDNYGDAGVCLRLARALVLHHGFTVRLWCDDVALLQRLAPELAPGLSVHPWHEHVLAQPAQGVICGFACSVDEAYLQAMRGCAVQPAYIHLEYLSAEPWVETTHGLWSTHPRLGLKQRFCSPGFTANTAGLLHEPAAPASEFSNQNNAQNNAKNGNTKHGGNDNDNDNDSTGRPLRVFVFAYLTQGFEAWIAAAKDVTQPVHWVLPQGAAGQALFAALQGLAGHTFTQLPFVSQLEFDTALRSCDAAWVRGEDSAVTALFAGIPMLWQLYVQNDDTHIAKLQAYLAVVDQALPDIDQADWRRAMQACNASPEIEPEQAVQALQRFLSSASNLTTHRTPHSSPHKAAPAALWAQHCRENVPDLAQVLSRWLREWKIP